MPAVWPCTFLPPYVPWAFPPLPHCTIPCSHFQPHTAQLACPFPALLLGALLSDTHQSRSNTLRAVSLARAVTRLTTSARTEGSRKRETISTEHCCTEGHPVTRKSKVGPRGHCKAQSIPVTGGSPEV